MKENGKAVHPKTEPVLFGGHDASFQIAQKLIAKHHTHLAEAKFLCLSRNKASKQGGIPVPGTVKKASPMEKYLGCAHLTGNEEPDFIIIIALDIWNEWQPAQRTAFVDHLLTRCMAEESDDDSSIRYRVRPPQVQEFSEVVMRNGAWNDSLRSLEEALDSK